MPRVRLTNGIVHPGSVGAGGPKAEASVANTHVLDLESTSSQYASITDAAQVGLDITGDITYECWFRCESLPINGSVRPFGSKHSNAANEKGYIFFQYNNAGVHEIRVSFSEDGNNADSIKWTYETPVGTWVHLAWVIDVSEAAATEAELFVNGVSQGNGTVVSDASAAGINNNARPFYIGVWEAPAFSGYQDGMLDECRIWNVKRTGAQILAYKSLSFTGPQTGLVGAWRLNNDYTDYSGNGNTLTPTNSPVFATTPLPFT